MATGQPIHFWACVSAGLFETLMKLDRPAGSPEFKFDHFRSPSLLLERHTSGFFDYLILEDGLSGMSADMIAQPMRSEIDIRPIIVVGSACDARTVTTYLRAGVDDYLVHGDVNHESIKESMRFAKEAARRRKSERDIRQVAAQLGAADNYTRMLVEHSSDMVVAVDLALRITEFNRAAERRFGYAREEMIGQHVSILYADHNQAWPVRMQTFKSGFIGEVRNRRKNGEVFVSALHACKVVDADGELVGVLGMSREITGEGNTLAEFQSVHEQFIRRTEELNRRECQIAEIERLDRMLVTRIADVARGRIESPESVDDIGSVLDDLQSDFDLQGMELEGVSKKPGPVALDRWFDRWRKDASSYAGLTIASTDVAAVSVDCDMDRLTVVFNRLVESLSRTPDAGIAVWPPEIIDSARGSKLVIRLTVSIPDECYERLRRLFSSKPAALPITRSAYAILELRILMTRRTAVAAAIEIDGEFDGDQCIISVSTMVNQKGRPTVARNAIENKESELISVGR